MKLSELSRQTGFSKASIKFFQREGLLAPPRLKNPTTGVYSARHASRLALIAFLRRDVDVPLRTVGALCALIDDPSVSDLDLMDACQVLASTPHLFPSDPTPPPHLPSEATDASTPATRATATVQELCEREGWPQQTTLARVALESLLEQLTARDIEIPVSYLETIASALSPVVTINLAAAGVRGDAPRDRNDLALDVIRGVRLHTRILLAVSNVAHAAASIRTLTGEEETPTRPPD